MSDWFDSVDCGLSFDPRPCRPTSPRNRRRSPPPLRSQTETSRLVNGLKPLTLRAAATVNLAV